MFIKEQLFRSAILIYLFKVRSVMKFDPILLIRSNFHGPLVTVFMEFHYNYFLPTAIAVGVAVAVEAAVSVALVVVVVVVVMVVVVM